MNRAFLLLWYMWFLLWGWRRYGWWEGAAQPYEGPVKALKAMARAIPTPVHFVLLFLLLGAPAARAQRPVLDAYPPVATAYAPGPAVVRIVLAYESSGRVLACRNLAKVEWTLPRGRGQVLGTADGHQLGILRFGKPGTYEARFLVRGGSCRGARGSIEIRVVPRPAPIAEVCASPCACGGWCGPRRSNPPWRKTKPSF